MSSVNAVARPGILRSGVLSEVTDFISRSNHLLDEELFAEWISLTDKSFQYDINAYSPEIMGHVVLMEKDRAGLQTLFDQLTMHERYLSNSTALTNPDLFLHFIACARESWQGRAGRQRKGRAGRMGDGRYKQRQQMWAVIRASLSARGSAISPARENAVLTWRPASFTMRSGWAPCRADVAS